MRYLQSYNAPPPDEQFRTIGEDEIYVLCRIGAAGAQEALWAAQAGEQVLIADGPYFAVTDRTHQIADRIAALPVQKCTTFLEAQLVHNKLCAQFPEARPASFIECKERYLEADHATWQPKYRQWLADEAFGRRVRAALWEKVEWLEKGRNTITFTPLDLLTRGPELEEIPA